MSASTPTVNTDYYIIVKKDANGTFTIEKDFPTATALDARPPTEIITDPDKSKVVYFPIKVTSGTKNDTNSFEVDGKTYELDLKHAMNPIPTDVMIVANKFDDFVKHVHPHVNPAQAPSATASPAPITNAIIAAIKTVANATDFNQLIDAAQNAAQNVTFSSANDITSVSNNKDDYLLINKQFTGDQDITSNGSQLATTYNNVISDTVNNIPYTLFRRADLEDSKKGGKKQKQRRSKRNYSKKQRKQWAKNNTLRNYFNYMDTAY